MVLSWAVFAGATETENEQNRRENGARKAIGGSSVDQTETLWYAILRNLQVTSRCVFQKAWEASVPKITRGFRGRPAGLDGPPRWRLHSGHHLAADLRISVISLNTASLSTSPAACFISVARVDCYPSAHLQHCGQRLAAGSIIPRVFLPHRIS